MCEVCASLKPLRRAGDVIVRFDTSLHVNEIKRRDTSGHGTAESVCVRILRGGEGHGQPVVNEQ